MIGAVWDERRAANGCVCVLACMRAFVGWDLLVYGGGLLCWCGYEVDLGGRRRISVFVCVCAFEGGGVGVLYVCISVCV